MCNDFKREIGVVQGEYMCMCLCVYVYVYAYMYFKVPCVMVSSDVCDKLESCRVSMCVCVCVRMYMCLCMYVYVYVYMYMKIPYVMMQRQMYTYIHTYGGLLLMMEERHG